MHEGAPWKRRKTENCAMNHDNSWSAASPPHMMIPAEQGATGVCTESMFEDSNPALLPSSVEDQQGLERPLLKDQVMCEQVQRNCGSLSFENNTYQSASNPVMGPNQLIVQAYNPSNAMMRDLPDDIQFSANTPSQCAFGGYFEAIAQNPGMYHLDQPCGVRFEHRNGGSHWTTMTSADAAIFRNVCTCGAWYRSHPAAFETAMRNVPGYHAARSNGAGNGNGIQ